MIEVHRVERGREPAPPPLLSPRRLLAVRRFHRSLPGYAPTPPVAPAEGGAGSGANFARSCPVRRERHPSGSGLFIGLCGSGAILALLVVLLPPATAAAPQAPEPIGPVEVVGIRVFLDEAGRVDWAPQGDRIAYDRLDHEGYRDVYVARARDGTGEECLTCALYEFRKRHAGNPVWHPSGDFVVFQAERPAKLGGRPVPFLAVPGANRGDDLWVVSTDGRRFGKLTNRGEQGGHVLNPRISPEADRIVWSERVASGGGLFGQWVLRVGDLELLRGMPVVRRVDTHRPARGRVFYESYGFSVDQRQVLYGANPDPEQLESGLDLFLLELESGEVTRLTDSPREWDRFAAFSPNGRKIAWAASYDIRGPRVPPERGQVGPPPPLDVWMMNADGSDRQRITFFNDPLSQQYSGRVTVSSMAWSPSGGQLLVHMAPLAAPDQGGLLVLELDRPVGR